MSERRFPEAPRDRETWAKVHWSAFAAVARRMGVSADYALRIFVGEIRAPWVLERLELRLARQRHHLRDVPLHLRLTTIEKQKWYRNHPDAIRKLAASLGIPTGFVIANLHRRRFPSSKFSSAADQVLAVDRCCFETGRVSNLLREPW